MTREPLAQGPDDEDGIVVPLVWLGLEETPVQAANQFIVQHDPMAVDEFYLTIGHVTPPAITGTPEEQREQAKRIQFVPVRPLGRFQLTRQRYSELLSAMQKPRSL